MYFILVFTLEKLFLQKLQKYKIKGLVMNVAFESCVVMKNVVIMALNDPSVSIMAVLYLNVVVISENAMKLLPPGARNFFISV